jgi:hypothetical protein
MADPSAPKPERSAGESLRTAIQQTLEAAARSARSGPSQTRMAAGELLDEVVRRGRETRDELTRRGHGARDELGRRGLEAREELARRLELVEARLRKLEARLRESQSEPEN